MAMSPTASTMSSAPSLAFALSKTPKITCTGVDNTPTPHSRVATPARAYAQSPFHNGGVTPICSPAHIKFGQATAISVIAPGGGTGINGQVYAELGQDPQFTLDVVGRSRAPYDCYPEYWQNGKPPPNLHSFAEDLVLHGWADKSDCLIFGSRGGQVVLPILWEHKGDRIPPTICINGGCAMKLPKSTKWPDQAVTFLLLGGADYFRGSVTHEEYMADAKSQVPENNATTAILFVKEMQHMPQQALLRSVLPIMVRAVLKWHANPNRSPKEELRALLSAVNRDGWNGRLMYTQAPGVWATDVEFGPFHVAQRIPCGMEAVNSNHSESSAPIEISRKDELKALFKAAALAAQPSQGAPLAHSGDRFHAAVRAAAKRQEQVPQPPIMQNPVPQRSADRPRLSLQLPIMPAGHHEEGRARAMSLQGLQTPGSGGARTPTGSQTPNGARTPKTPNRLMPPGTDRRWDVAPTPISFALGMASFQMPPTSPSGTKSRSISPSQPVPMVSPTGLYTPFGSTTTTTTTTTTTYGPGGATTTVTTTTTSPSRRVTASSGGGYPGSQSGTNSSHHGGGTPHWPQPAVQVTV